MALADAWGSAGWRSAGTFPHKGGGAGERACPVRAPLVQLARLDFVASLELRTEAFTVKGRVHLTQRGFVEVYCDERTQTVAVAWLEAERRTMRMQEIIQELGAVWKQAMQGEETG